MLCFIFVILCHKFLLLAVFQVFILTAHLQIALQWSFKDSILMDG